MRPTAALGLSGRDFLALACFLASGFAGLAYEIAWIRKASLVFGATSLALSTVLAVFFGGLALGSWGFGRLATRVRRPLGVYAALEAGIGGLALASPLAFRAADAVYTWLYPQVYESFALLSVIRLLGSTLILLPPTILIGGTLPLFCQQYVRSRNRIARSVGLLYGVNTLGAAAGCAAAGFLLIPRLGVDGTLRLGASLSFAVALLVAWMPGPTEVAPGTTDAPEPVPPPGEERPGRVIPSLFFLIGFTALASEVLWTRFLSLLVRNTVHTYTVTLTVILVGIVAGSALSARFFDASNRRPLFFGAAQVATALVVVGVLTLPPGFWSAWMEGPDLESRVWVALLVLLVPAVLSGMSFPLAVRMVLSDPRLAGRTVGWMAALNTAGGIAGSLATGFLILPLLGLHATLLAITGTSLATGLLAWILLGALRGPLALCAGAGLSIGVWLAIPALSGTRLPADFLGGEHELVDFREGIGAQLAVVRGKEGLILEIDRLWQGEERKNHQIMAAHVPMLLSPEPRRVLLVGLGVGQTASRFLMYPVERLDCVEIESELVPLVERHFDSDWMQDERVRFLFEDGWNFLTHADATYDVISVEIGQVFRPRLASFYTIEFYDHARQRLSPGGLLSQFLPIRYLTPEHFRILVATFLEAFPQSVLWYNKAELLLIGSNGVAPGLSAARLAALKEDEALRRDLEFAYWGGPAQWLNRPEVFLSGFLVGPAGLARIAEDAPVYRSDRPYLEYEIPPHQVRSEREVLELIESHAEPVQQLLDFDLDEAAAKRIAALRRTNLRDILASELIARANLLQPGGDGPQPAELLRRALRLNPYNRWAINNMGNQLRLQGKPALAIGRYRRAIELEPDFPEAYTNLAMALAAVGRTDESIQALREAVRLEPRLVEAHMLLARTLEALGDDAAALAHYRSAAEASPTAAGPYLLLGASLQDRGEPEEAAEAYREALRRDPKQAPAHFGLATVLIASGRVDEGRAHLRAALDLQPDWPRPLNDLAWSLATAPGGDAGDAAEAVELAERAAELTGHESGPVLDTLAACYAAAGRYDRAAATARAALEQAQRAGLDALAHEIRARLSLYESGRAYRVSPTPG